MIEIPWHCKPAFDELLGSLSHGDAEQTDHRQRWRVGCAVIRGDRHPSSAGVWACKGTRPVLNTRRVGNFRGVVVNQNEKEIHKFRKRPFKSPFLLTQVLEITETPAIIPSCRHQWLTRQVQCRCRLLGRSLACREPFLPQGLLSTSAGWGR